MTTYVLIHGAGSDSSYWHLVTPRLEALGHRVVAPDLPCDDDTATFVDYADVTVAALDHSGSALDDQLVVVAQSLGGFTAPLVCARVPASLLVLVAAMVPTPGESAGEWWTNTGHDAARRALADSAGRSIDDEFDPVAEFFNGVPVDVTAEAMSRPPRNQSGRVLEDPWPLSAWPDVPTRFLLCRDDRFFPAEFQRRVVQERLGLVPDEMDGGHLPALGRPDDLVARLEVYRTEL